MTTSTMTAPADEHDAPAEERITSNLELLLVVLILAALATAVAVATWGISDVGADATCPQTAGVRDDANPVVTIAVCG